MNNFKITKTILENINEQNDRINECVDIVTGYTTDEETRVSQELQRQENELRREEQYNNNENRFNEINTQLDSIENEKATRQEVDVERKRIDNINSSLDNIESQVESVINMEQFPRLDGETTDTNRIKRAINYSIEILKTNGIGSFKIIEFNSGKYIIDSEIQIPVFIKFKSIGNVIFISKVNGTMFKMYTPNDLIISESINIPSARWSLYNGMWLNGIDGGITIIKDSSIDKKGTIAL